MYVWNYELIKIDGRELPFVVVDTVDMPVELVSSKGEYYALYITDTEKGELWFVIDQLPEELLAGYLKGEVHMGALFSKGRVRVFERPFEDYTRFVETSIPVSAFKIPDAFLKLEIHDFNVYQDFVKTFEKPFVDKLVKRKP